MNRRLIVILLTLTLLIPFAVSAQTTPPEVEIALADLNTRLGTTYTLDSLDISESWSWAEQRFLDASLGCPQPDQLYAQVESQAYVITFTIDNQMYDYRAPRASNQAIFCSVTTLPEATETPPATGGEWEYVAVAGSFNPHLAWSPSGAEIAVSGVVESSGAAMGMILLYNPADLTELPRQVPLNQPVTALEYLATDPVIYLVTGAGAGDVAIFPVEPEGLDILMMQTSDVATVTDVAISENQQVIASVNAAQNDPALSDLWSIHLWNASTGEALSNLEAPAPVTSLDINGSLIAAGVLGGGVAIYDITSGEQLGFFGGGGNAIAVTEVSFSPDGTMLAVANGMTVTLWDTTDPANLTISQTYISDSTLLSLDFSADGAFLAAAGGDPSVPNAATSAIRVWDTTTGEIAATLRGHTDAVGDIAFSPDGVRLASVSYDGTLRVWQLGIAVG